MTVHIEIAQPPAEMRVNRLLILAQRRPGRVARSVVPCLSNFLITTHQSKTLRLRSEIGVHRRVERHGHCRWRRRAVPRGASIL